MVPREDFAKYVSEYGDLYKQAHQRVQAAKGKPLTSLFDLPKDTAGKTRTEILFVERCLSLLKPGGRLGIVLPEGIFNNPSMAYVRQFCEDRAFVRAVVSLPPETFVSAGAGVKASLLFLQKYNTKEKSHFDKLQAAARAATVTKHAAEIKTETDRLEAEIAAAKIAKDSVLHMALKKQLATYLRCMEGKKNAEARLLLKQQSDYSVFLYEAKNVGITTTGEVDTNDLFPNIRVPEDVKHTCLELYQEFLASPKSSHLTDNQASDHSSRLKILQWSTMEIWAAPRRIVDATDLPAGWTLVRAGDLLKRVGSVAVIPDQTYKMAGVRLYGEGVFHRESVKGADLSTAKVTPLVQGAFLYNRLFAWKGSFAVVESDHQDCFVSAEFPEWIVDRALALPEYLYLFFMRDDTIREVDAASVGSSAVSRNRFKEELFLEFKIPLPPVPEQEAVVARWRTANQLIVDARKRADELIEEINKHFIDNKDRPASGKTIPE